MEQALDWIFNQHWGEITAFVMVVAMFVNGHTKNWKEWPTWVGKIAGLVVKVASLWTADRPTPEQPPSYITGITKTGIVVLLLGIGGCATVSKTLDAVHVAAVEVRKQGMPVFDAICLRDAKQCFAEGISEPDCQPLAKCREARLVFTDALKAVQVAFAVGKIGVAREDEEGAAMALAKAQALLGDAGVYLEALYPMLARIQ
jgi:hypothetical protein